MTDLPQTTTGREDLAPGMKFSVEDGMTIMPHIVEVEVTWLDEDTVWYRKAGSAVVIETPRNRFEEIVNARPRP